MTDTIKPPASGKANIILPAVRKPKPADFRNDFKNKHNQKGFASIKNNNVRRAGPRGG